MEKLSLKRSMKKKLRQFFDLRLFWFSYKERAEYNGTHVGFRVWKNYINGTYMYFVLPISKKDSWIEVKRSCLD